MEGDIFQLSEAIFPVKFPTSSVSNHEKLRCGILFHLFPHISQQPNRANGKNPLKDFKSKGQNWTINQIAYTHFSLTLEKNVQNLI